MHDHEGKIKGKNAALTVTSAFNVSDTWIEHVTFSHNGNCIAACSHTVVYVFGTKDTLEGKCACQLDHPDIVWKSVFSPKDDTLFTSGANGSMYAWDVTSKDLLYSIELERQKRSLFGIAVSPDGNQAVLSSVVGNIHVVCLVNKEVVASVSGHSESIEDICYSPSGNLVASCAKEGRIKLWLDIEFTFRTVRKCEGHTHWVYSCCFSANETLLISASADKTIKLWSPATCECLKTFLGHKNIVWCAQFLNKEATVIVSCSSDETIRLWGVEAGKVLEKLRNPGCYNYRDGCPRDQLFWCTVNQRHANLAIGSYHGNIYITSISIPNLDKKNKIKLKIMKRMAQQEQEKKIHQTAVNIVKDALNKAVNILQVP